MARLVHTAALPVREEPREREAITRSDCLGLSADWRVLGSNGGHSLPGAGDLAGLDLFASSLIDAVGRRVLIFWWLGFGLGLGLRLGFGLKG